MKRYLLLILSLAVLFTGCNYCLSTMLPKDVCACLPWNNRGVYPRSYLIEREFYDRIVYDRIMYHVAEMAIKFKHERRMKLENSTLQFDGGIKSMRLDFTTMVMMELQQGREILVDITEDFLRRINNDSTITPYLWGGGISPFNLEIQIDLQCWMGKLVDFDYVGWITLKEGIAHYYAFDARTFRLDWWQLRNETYYESLRVVEYTRQAEAEFTRHEKEKEGPSALDEERFKYEGQ